MKTFENYYNILKKTLLSKRNSSKCTLDPATFSPVFAIFYYFMHINQCFPFKIVTNPNTCGKLKLKFQIKSMIRYLETRLPET